MGQCHIIQKHTYVCVCVFFWLYGYSHLFGQIKCRGQRYPTLYIALKNFVWFFSSYLSVNFGHLFALSICSSLIVFGKKRRREWEAILRIVHMELLTWNRHIAFSIYFIIIVSSGDSLPYMLCCEKAMFCNIIECDSVQRVMATIIITHQVKAKYIFSQKKIHMTHEDFNINLSNRKRHIWLAYLMLKFSLFSYFFAWKCQKNLTNSLCEYDKYKITSKKIKTNEMFNVQSLHNWFLESINQTDLNL